MYYIAGIEVTEVDAVPAGMVHRVIPAGRYASFTHKGKLSVLDDTVKFIYGTWVRQSRDLLRDGPNLELYDGRFDPNSDQSEFDILLPAK
jgi:AraC family transcriptional regulator